MTNRKQTGNDFGNEILFIVKQNWFAKNFLMYCHPERM